MLVLAPGNHLVTYGCSPLSRTALQGWNHSSSLAAFAQNSWKFSTVLLRYLWFSLIVVPLLAQLGSSILSSKGSASPTKVTSSIRPHIAAFRYKKCTEAGREGFCPSSASPARGV